jgi:hypothetical protein
VREVPPARWICSFPLQTCAHTQTFSSGSTVTGQDFGNYKLARLSGVEFIDYNRTGHQDPGDPGLGGWIVYVDYNNNGKLDPGEPYSITATGAAPTARDAAAGQPSPLPPGAYSITGIEPGSWTIREIPQNGLPCTYPSNCSYQQAFESNSQITAKDFATFKPRPVPGRASLHAPTGCVVNRFVAWVSGRQISSVSFKIDGSSKGTISRATRGRYGLRVKTGGLSTGVHRLFVTVNFTKKSATKPKHARHVFVVCRPTVPEPTG